MSSISAQDLQRLAGLQGYDLTLEIDVLSRKYGMSPDEIVAVLRAATQSQQPTQQPFEPVASKTVPELPNRPREISMQGLHFDYIQPLEQKTSVPSRSSHRVPWVWCSPWYSKSQTDQNQMPTMLACSPYN